ncbi:MAG: flagellar basal body P-ring formation chaperone FlgA [Phycisphaerales bacterium]|nr:flagellar basal body P-ring formation chaperone FlgA [Phycisphaerales bacterium]
MTHLTRIFVLFILATLSVATQADSITLRASIRTPVDGNGIIRLTDIARLDGVEAMRFADVRIVTSAGAPEVIEIDVQDVHALLDQAGINWAEVELAGGTTVVRPRVTSAVTLGLNRAVESHGDIEVGSSKAAQAKSDARAPAFQSMDAWRDQDPVVDEILDIVSQEWGADSQDLHLAIDTTALAGLPDDATACTVRTRGPTRGADFFDVQVRATRGAEGLRPTKTVLLRVDARIRTEATVAKSNLRDRRTLRMDDLDVATCLLKPSDAVRMLDSSALVGRKLVSSVDSGQPVLWSALEPEIVVKRNDSVRVVMRGAFRLSGNDAIALERGSVGDRIKCRWRAGDEPFVALVTGPGEVRAGG